MQLLLLLACVWIGDDHAARRLDPDGDGVPAGQDCDDRDGTSGAFVTYWADTDDDGWGDPELPLGACARLAGFATRAGDCDDADPAVHPGAPEPDCADPKDYDCDGAGAAADADGDGAIGCEDCDDADATAFPGAVEACGGGDEDCDGTVDEPDAAGAPSWYLDADGDGFGDPDQAVVACAQPVGFVADAQDCDDRHPEALPGGVEVCDPLDVDEDCDGEREDAGVEGETPWYRDADGDGWGDEQATAWACDAPEGYAGRLGDCDDADVDAHPGALETCDDGVDQDCDGGDPPCP